MMMTTWKVWDSFLDMMMMMMMVMMNLVLDTCQVHTHTLSYMTNMSVHSLILIQYGTVRCGIPGGAFW